MSPADYIRWLVTPEKDRWKPMLMGLALCAASAGTAVLVQPSLVSLAFLILAMLAWFVGGCGMVGYVRWFFASEIAQAHRDNAGLIDKKNR